MTPLHEASVLVVEDSDEDWDTVLQVARETGFEALLRRAVDGDACLALLRGADGVPLKPVLVLLDLSLPGIDGREVLAAIKADPALHATPVVVCSTSSNPLDVAACYAAGVNAFHVKPLRHDRHLQALRLLFDYWLSGALLPVPHAVTP